MSLTFYYSPMSTASVTHHVLEELGVPFEKVLVKLKDGDQKKPEFLKLNPNGKVPMVVHDGTSIWESAALTIYLGETFGVDKKLFPAAGPARGEAMKWIVWTNASLGDAIGTFAKNTMDWYPAEQRNAKAGEAGLKAIHEHLAILDGALAGKSYLVGGDYTLADTHVHSFTDWLRHMKLDMAAYKNMNAWHERIVSRAAYKKVEAGGH